MEMARTKSILVGGAALLTAAGLLLGGYFVTNTMLNAAWAAGDGQQIMGPTGTPTTQNPAQTVPSNDDQTTTSGPSNQPIQLTISDWSAGQPDARPGAEDISSNDAAQIMARSVRDYFDENVEGSTVDGLIFLKAIESLYLGGISDSGSVVITQGPGFRPTWLATVTTPGGTAYCVTVDAVTGQVYSVQLGATQTAAIALWSNEDGTGQIYSQVYSVDPLPGSSSCSAISQVTPAEAALGQVASDFVTTKLGLRVSTTKVLATLQTPGSVLVAIQTDDGSGYLVTVDADHAVTGFRVLPNGVPDDLTGC